MITFALKLVVAIVLSPFALWVFYVAVMRLKQVRDAGKLTKATTVLGYLTLAIGLVLDAVVNLCVGSIVFRERPREWTLSARLTRLAANGTERQQRIAIAIRTALLDDIDPAGVHQG